MLLIAAAVLCGQLVTGIKLVTAKATDVLGVATVQIFVDGTPLKPPFPGSSLTASWDTTKVTDGCHTITAQAVDTVGNVGNATLLVEVNNKTNKGKKK